MSKWLWCAALVLGLDQASKYWIQSTFRLYESHDLLPFLRLFYVHNTGAAFSFLSTAGGWQRWFFSAVAVLAVGLVFGWLRRLEAHQKRLALGLSLILGGAIGNLIDRLRFGYVVDFIDAYYQSWHWPVFNVADSAITVGVVLVLLDALLSPDSKSKDASASR